MSIVFGTIVLSLCMNITLTQIAVVSLPVRIYGLQLLELASDLVSILVGIQRLHQKQSCQHTPWTGIKPSLQRFKPHHS